jgi:catechol 2,3-dioxygenase-like lactoylglutathione lyase family enzyme
MSEAPRIECDRQHPNLTVADVVAAVAFYTEKLGFTLGFTWGDPPQMAGVLLDRVQVFLSRGTPSPGASSVYFPVGDADELHEFHRAGGVEIVVPIGDREYAMRDYGVRDHDGNRLDFGHPIFNVGPPIEIERVDLPVRIEKRMAAVLLDLAAAKRMSLASCLEETLLHTFEPSGDGVASPHTSAHLRLIQELKKKHGIDYDSHGSYRFVEKNS